MAYSRLMQRLSLLHSIPIYHESFEDIDSENWLNTLVSYFETYPKCNGFRITKLSWWKAYRSNAYCFTFVKDLIHAMYSLHDSQDVSDAKIDQNVCHVPHDIPNATKVHVDEVKNICYGSFLHMI